MYVLLYSTLLEVLKMTKKQNKYIIKTICGIFLLHCPAKSTMITEETAVGIGQNTQSFKFKVESNSPLQRIAWLEDLLPKESSFTDKEAYFYKGQLEIILKESNRLPKEFHEKICEQTISLSKKIIEKTKPLLEGILKKYIEDVYDTKDYQKQIDLDLTQTTKLYEQLEKLDVRKDSNNESLSNILEEFKKIDQKRSSVFRAAYLPKSLGLDKKADFIPFDDIGDNENKKIQDTKLQIRQEYLDEYKKQYDAILGNSHRIYSNFNRLFKQKEPYLKQEILKQEDLNLEKVALMQKETVLRQIESLNRELEKKINLTHEEAENYQNKINYILNNATKLKKEYHKEICEQTISLSEKVIEYTKPLWREELKQYVDLTLKQLIDLGSNSNATENLKRVKATIQGIHERRADFRKSLKSQAENKYFIPFIQFSDNIVTEDGEIDATKKQIRKNYIDQIEKTMWKELDGNWQIYKALIDVRTKEGVESESVTEIFKAEMLKFYEEVNSNIQEIKEKIKSGLAASLEEKYNIIKELKDDLEYIKKIPQKWQTQEKHKELYNLTEEVLIRYINHTYYQTKEFIREFGEQIKQQDMNNDVRTKLNSLLNDLEIISEKNRGQQYSDLCTKINELLKSIDQVINNDSQLNVEDSAKKAE